jgi:hypothetical protein
MVRNRWHCPACLSRLVMTGLVMGAGLWPCRGRIGVIPYNPIAGGLPRYNLIFRQIEREMGPLLA